jgi:hypothetical protein
MRTRMTSSPLTGESVAVPAHLLSALERHARPTGPGRSPITGPSPIVPAHARPAPGAGAPTSADLPRRVRGAQLPSVQPSRLRPYQQPGPAPGDGDGQGAARRDGPARADEVYAFLSGFSAGVQRGLDEARGDGGSSS